MISDQSLLEAALVGYVHQRDQIEAKIAEIRQELGGSATTPGVSSSKRRTMSAAGRARVAAAQRKRWAAQRNGSPAPKRKMSAAGRKRIAEATKKRWAAYRAQKVAAKF